MDGICSAHAMVVRAKPALVLPEFLPFLMMSDKFMNRAEVISVGSFSPTINWTTLKLEEFDLPPLDQQRCLAEILWAVDGVSQSAWKIRESIFALRRAAHREVFVEGLNTSGKTPEDGELPVGWRLSTVGESCLTENRLRKPINAAERATMQGEYPYCGPTGILDHLNEWRVDGEYVLIGEDGDYISLPDMVRNFEGGSGLIKQWLKNMDTVLFLGVWERIHNPGFNSLEFEGIRNEAGRNSFFLSAKAWVERTRANPKRDGNMRDHATIEQLLVLANIEGMNAEFIHMALPQGDRLKRLNPIAIRQMQTFTAGSTLRQREPPKDRKE